MNDPLTRPPCAGERSFLDFPVLTDLNRLDADFAVLGVPYGKPYNPDEFPNDQSNAPDALRLASSDADIFYTRNHYDYDLGGVLLDDRDLTVVDCGNVTHRPEDPAEHYRRAESAARRIYDAGTILIGIGGDHGVTIPLMRGLEDFGEPVTLVHVDAHLDWRNEINGETEGYSSPIRRAAEMPWVEAIVQIGMRGIGSARQPEVDDARSWGADVITAYEMHAMGMDAVLARIPEGRPYYLSIDADGVDPTIMPGVLAPTPGGLDWLQLRSLVHGLIGKGRVVGMDIVEIAPKYDVRNLTLVYAERLICNFIGASLRAGHCRR